MFCMWKFIKHGARNMRLKGKLVKPGVLEGLHADVAGGIQFAGTAIAKVKAFLRGKL